MTRLPPLPSLREPANVRRQEHVSLPKLVSGRSFVYRLIDPFTCHPRYVGYTNDPIARLNQHRRAARKLLHRPVYAWWQELVDREDLQPVMQFIEIGRAS